MTTKTKKGFRVVEVKDIPKEVFTSNVVHVHFCKGPIPVVSISFANGYRMDVHSPEGTFQVVPAKDNPYFKLVPTFDFKSK